MITPSLSMPWMWNDCSPRSIASRSSDMLSSFVEPRWWQKSGRRPSHNTRIAVARILGDGKRQRTRVFAELQSHYLFKDRFGRPGKGNDKGKVEGLVGYARRNYLVPIPMIERPSAGMLPPSNDG